MKPQDNTKFPQRINLPHARLSWVSEAALYFITVNCLERGINTLCHAETADLLRESVEYRAKRADWHVRLLLLMPDHLHMLATFPNSVQMKKVITGWKGYTAKRCGFHWQRDFFDHRLRSDESYVEKAAYIRDNPVRKELIDEPSAWPYVWTWE